MSVRKEKLAMAKARAMNKEENRENVLDGRGATPSMGLSEVRGGSFHAVGGARTGRYEGEGHHDSAVEQDQDDFNGNMEGAGMHGGFLPLLGLLTPLLGNMIKNAVSGKNLITGNGRYRKKVEAGLEGAGLHGGFLPLLGLLTPLIGNMIKNAVSGKNLITGNGMMPPPEGHKGAWKGIKAMHVKQEGMGHCGAGSSGAGSSGAGHTGAGGRSKRASIVKKVMAEKGLKLIEASKYVKEHNLYHP